jgi:hypothetical protein
MLIRISEYSEYLAESVDKHISYTVYLKTLDKTLNILGISQEGLDKSTLNT